MAKYKVHQVNGLREIAEEILKSVKPFYGWGT